jgi:putative membrane protein
VDDPRSLVVVYLKGICMGAADAVPGVSGGTVALIVGIYERLIDAITAVTVDRALAVLAFPLPGRRRAARRAFREADGSFLLALGVGVLSAVLLVTRLLDWALDAVPVPTFGVFFGLILASAVLLYGEVRLNTPGRVVAAVAGFVVAFLLSGSADATLGSGTVVVFLSGAVAISAMLLPGLSGSFLLLLLGQYEFMTERLTRFVDALAAVPSGGDPSAVVAPGVVVTAFLAGAVVGLFTVSHAVRYALDRRREATMAFLVSLVVGALRAPVERVGVKLAEPSVDPVWTERLLGVSDAWTPGVVAVFALAALVGGAAVLGLERVAGVVDVDPGVAAGGGAPAPETDAEARSGPDSE